MNGFSKAGIGLDWQHVRPTENVACSKFGALEPTQPVDAFESYSLPQLSPTFTLLRRGQRLASVIPFEHGLG